MSNQIRYYSAADVREFDRRAIEDLHIPGFELMLRAGRAAFNALLWQWPEARCIRVFSGTGNNGGDGFVIAALAQAAGIDAAVYVVGSMVSIKGSALQALELARGQGVPLQELAAPPDLAGLPPDAVIVDALLGTGLTGEPRGLHRQVIDMINASHLPVLAVDIPSGLCSDTGRVLGACVKAAITVTFIGRKQGLVCGDGPGQCGTVVFDDLGVPQALLLPGPQSG